MERKVRHSKNRIEKTGLKSRAASNYIYEYEDVLEFVKFGSRCASTGAVCPPASRLSAGGC
jgi:hypothetical protein